MNLTVLPNDVAALSEKYREAKNFKLAAVSFIKLYLKNFSDNFVLNHLSNTEVHHMIAAYLFYLHYWRDSDDPTSGATLTRVQEFCAKHKLAGPRKVAALLGVAQAAGFFTRDASDVDTRVKIFRPTARAIAALKGVIGSHIAAIEMIEQTGIFRAYLDSQPGAVIAISSHGFHNLYMGGAQMVDAVDELKPFLDMNGGIKIIFSAYANTNQNLFFHANFWRISKVFGISRTQVHRILLSAEEAGQIKLSDRGGRKIQLMPSMVELVETYISIYLAAMAIGARQAIAFDGWRKEAGGAQA